MLNPGAAYLAAQSARVNHITQKCVIEIGDLALNSQGATASASSTFSADWPASAIVNGDLTHINAGAPSVADNDIGGGVWQGSIVAAGDGTLGTPEVLTVDLGQLRKVNRLKLIFWPEDTLSNNLGAIAPADFLIEYFDPGAAAWVPWTGLADKCAEIGKAATTIVAGQVTGNANDMVAFEDPTPRTFQLYRVTMTKLQSGGVRARVVEAPITWAVDVSGFVSSSKRARQKDYHLQRRTAAELNVTLINFDKRFNDKHTPTAAEVANGFFSNFIRPHLPIRYFAGFSGLNVQMFSGTVETWNPNTARRTVDLVALDFLKSLVKPTLTTKLKQGILIEALVEYVANLQNFPSNMMLLDSTSLTVGYFFPIAQSISKIIADLQDATGDAEIYVDEVGRLLYRNYNTLVSHQYQAQDQVAWLSGTLVNIDLISLPGSIRRAWFQVNSFSPFAPTGGGARAVFTQNTGTWMMTATPGGINPAQLILMTNADPIFPIGYELRATSVGGPSTQIKFIRRTGGGAGVDLFTTTVAGTATADFRFTRDSSNQFKIYRNGVLLGTLTDASYTSFANLFFNGGVSAPDIYWSQALDGTTATSNAAASWLSPVQNFSAAVASIGLILASLDAPGASAVNILTRSGPTPVPDGSWSAFTAATPGSNFPSPLNTYGQIEVFLVNDVFTTSTLSQLSLDWKVSAGAARSITPDWKAADYGLLLANNRQLSSIVGGNNFIFTQSIVKANPLILSGASVTAWQGTNNNAAISPSNPLFVPVGDTVINVDFGNTAYGVPQTVNVTFGTAVGTATLSSHPTSPTLTLSISTAGTITALTISGFPFLSTTTIQATAYASDFVKQNYDENIDELDNDYIDNVVLAQDIADNRIARFGQGALDWIKEAGVRFFPGAQLNDNVNIVDSFAEINANYYLIGATDELMRAQDRTFSAKTTGELVRVS